VFSNVQGRPDLTKRHVDRTVELRGFIVRHTSTIYALAANESHVLAVWPEIDPAVDGPLFLELVEGIPLRISLIGARQRGRGRISTVRGAATDLLTFAHFRSKRFFCRGGFFGVFACSGIDPVVCGPGWDRSSRTPVLEVQYLNADRAGQLLGHQQ
jgi:hypothetical protein